MCYNTVNTYDITSNNKICDKLLKINHRGVAESMELRRE